MEDVIMANYPVRREDVQKLTVKSIVNLERCWAFFGSDGSLIQYPKENNPKPKRKDIFRYYLRHDRTIGLFLEAKSGEIYDIHIGEKKLIVREAKVVSLSD